MRESWIPWITIDSEDKEFEEVKEKDWKVNKRGREGVLENNLKRRARNRALE